jgi:class 3 adenylate cyclase
LRHGGGRSIRRGVHREDRSIAGTDVGQLLRLVEVMQPSAAQVKGTWALPVAAASGLMVASVAGLIALRAGGAGAAIVQAQVVGIAHLVAGAIAWRRRPDNATGPLLMAIGGSWYIPEFQAAPVPAVAALAWATRRLVNLVSAYLMLAFPSGRLGLLRHRLAIGLAIATTAIGIPTRLLLTERIPADLQHVDRVITSGCDCDNPFWVGTGPGLLASIEFWSGFPTVAAALIVMGLVILRLTQATAPMRRVLWPVLFGAIVASLIFAFNVLSSTLAMTTALTGALTWVLSLARAAVPVGFLVGLLRMKMDKAAVANLVVGLHGERTADSLERSIADALHDPSVKIGYWSPAAGTYVDGTGKVLTMPRPGSGLSVAFVERADAPLGAIIHDAVLDDDKALIDAVSAAFALALDRDRLASTVHAQASDARQLPSGPVTFLYADVEGSTVLLDRLGERYADVLAEERRLLRTIIREHGGFEIDSRADEFFAAFPEPADPVGAALKIQRRLRDHAWPDGAAVRVRIGLHSGQPQMTDEGYVGLDVHRATRIGSAGHGGQILLSEATCQRIESRLPPDATAQRLGAFGLKGLPGLESISQLTVPDLPDAFPPLRLETPARVTD